MLGIWWPMQFLDLFLFFVYRLLPLWKPWVETHWFVLTLVPRASTELLLESEAGCSSRWEVSVVEQDLLSGGLYIYIYCTLYTAEPCWTCIYIYLLYIIYIYNIHRVVNIYICIVYIYSSICYEAYKQLSLVGVRRNAIYQSHDPNIQWLTRCKTSWDCQFVYGQYLYMLSLSHNPCMDTHMDFMTFSASFI